MKTVYILICLLCYQVTFAQVQENILTALQKMEKDEQFKHAIISLYVIDSKTGQIITDFNSESGVAPASTLKVVTSASAFHMLGKDFRFASYFGTDGTQKETRMPDNFIFEGHGDPTLGSWRWPATAREKVFDKIVAALKRNNIHSFTGSIFINDLIYNYQPQPDGWIWQDMGNYYGAAAWGLNWHENKYALNLRPGNSIGEKTQIISTEPVDLTQQITNLITTGAKGSGDRSYIYSAPYSKEIFATGTIPAAEKKFTIYGAMPDPPIAMGKEIGLLFDRVKIPYNNKVISFSSTLKKEDRVPKMKILLDSIVSPSLDSMNVWFMKESINLYGEAFVKAIGHKLVQDGSTDSGVAVIRRFWAMNGITPSSLKMIDGSGLSPANRVTVRSLVQVLQFARSQSWFSSYYNAIPQMNDIKMKSGYINGVRAYTGYIKNNKGKEYTFAFIINNFDGSAGSVREKMWRLLDVLK